VEGLKTGAVINIVETKTGKDNVLVINKYVHKAFQAYLSVIVPAPDDYLFKRIFFKGMGSMDLR